MKRFLLLALLAATPLDAQTPLSTAISTLPQIAPKRIAAGSAGWLEPIIPSTESNAVVRGLSSNGSGGTLGACRTSDSTSTGSQGCQGLAGFAINNNTAQAQSAYAGYLEARRYSGVGAATQGLETNVLNGGSTVDETPYSFNTAGLTEAYRASCGRSDTTLNNPCSAAYIVTNNGAPNRRGLVVTASGLDPTGPNEALSMGSGQRVAWYKAAGALGSLIYGGTSRLNVAGGELDLFSQNVTGTFIDCAFMAFGNNSFACDNSIDIGTSVNRWSRVYAVRYNMSLSTPASSSDTCVQGDILADASYFYVCIATNTWKRAALSAF